MFSPLVGWDNTYKNEGPLSLGDTSQKTPLFLEITMFAQNRICPKKLRKLVTELVQATL